MDYTVVVENADDGSYGVYVPDLPGCVSSGDTPGQALDSIREAIREHIQLLKEHGESIPKPRSFAAIVPAA
ncbi:MAG: hypothetical protein HJJLKODD_00025 [Phycisphaerae bacterium]|nr:hypothetical protein [Phycisphaerae bacterium]